MRRLSRSERGLSEIVGTLMLVIIVVSAATLLAAFVATYQKQVQTEEAFNHDQSLESIHIINLNTTVKSGAYGTFGFTVASAYVNPSIVLDISINNQPLRFFNWTDLMNGSTGSFRVGGNLNISSDEQVYVWLDLNPLTPEFSFFGSGSIPTPNTYLKFDVFTYLQNDFQRVFLPPTALAVASEINPSGNNPITLLDGSSSFQPEGNGSLVNWSWEVTGGVLGSTPTSSSSDKILTPGSAVLVGENTTLGVYNYSYTGTATANFSVPLSYVYETGDPIYPTAPIASYISYSDPSCTVDSATFSATNGTAHAGTAMVNFTFSTVFTCSGAHPTGAVVFSGTGAATLADYVLANGEEVELSPALPADTYSVLLVVTNNDGLVGSTTLSYTSSAP